MFLFPKDCVLGTSNVSFCSLNSYPFRVSLAQHIQASDYVTKECLPSIWEDLWLWCLITKLNTEFPNWMGTICYLFPIHVHKDLVSCHGSPFSLLNLNIILGYLNSIEFSHLFPLFFFLFPLSILFQRKQYHFWPGSQVKTKSNFVLSCSGGCEMHRMS